MINTLLYIASRLPLPVMLWVAALVCLAPLAHATVWPGDIAVIGMNTVGSSGSSREFTVVTLAPILAGETIFVTDKGISGGVFQGDLGTEGIFSWTTSGYISSGMVIRFTITSGASPTVVATPAVGTLTVTNGWTNTASPFGANGDQVIVYQQAEDATLSFIFAFNNGTNGTGVNNGWNTTGGTGNNYSEIPPGLTEGTNAIGFAGTTPLDNYVYTGFIRWGEKSTLLAELCNRSNWSFTDATPYDLSPGGAQFPGSNPIFTMVTPNSAPTDLTLSATAINENAPGNSIVATLTTTDSDPGNTFTYTVPSFMDNDYFNISGNKLRITNPPDFEAKSTYNIRVIVYDQGGLGYVESFTITINDLNEAPTGLNLSANSIDENVAGNSTVGTLSVTDPDAANTFTYTLTTGGGDTDNASFNINGNSLRITNPPNFEAKNSYSVRVRTTDQSGLSYEQAFAIAINNLNETPTGLALSANAMDENAAGNSTVGALSATDPDAANSFTYTLVTGTGDTDNAAFNISGSSLRITARPNFETKSSYSVRIRTTDQGGLTYEDAFVISINNLNEAPAGMALSANSMNENAAANSTVGTLSSTDPDAANTFTYTLISGTGDTDNVAFNISGSSLRITASPNFETRSSYTVRIRTTDQGGLTYEEAFAISINNLNEAPVGMALSANAMNENAVANSTVGTLSSTDPDAANTFTYTLVSGTGDADNAAFNISGSNLRKTASPDFESKSSYTVRIRTTDQGGLNYEDAFTITINNVNEAPAGVALSANSINENAAANSIIGTLSATDPDAASTFTYTLISGTGDTDNAAFNISGSSLRITASPNFETRSSYSVRIRTADQGGLTYDEVFTISINNLNEAPTGIGLSANSINEHAAANSTVGTLSATDPDAANTFTYTLVTGTGDADNTSFNISGSNLRINASPNFETRNSYNVRIRTTDQGGLGYEETFTITINNINEAPAGMALSANAMNENAAANSTVGTLSSTDPDAANTFTYTLATGTGDADNTSFNISGNSLRITASPNFEIKNSYSIRVRTTDQGGLSYEQTFIITINNANEAPTGIALSSNSMNENVAGNSTIGTLSAADPDAANTFTYTLISGTGDTDNAAFNISGSSLRITASPNFETKSSHSVRIRTTDQGGLMYDEAFTISINNLNEAPTGIGLSANSINENAAANSTVGTLSATDPDAANTFTYTLVTGTGGTDNAAFNISGNSLRITASPNFETKSSYSIRIRTTDQGGLTYEEAFTISINNLNEPPAGIALSANSMNENVAINSTVGTLSATDPDAASTFTYTLVTGTGDTDNAVFNISGSSLRITTSPDFETKSSYSVRIRTTDQGGLTYEEAFTITIHNVNDAPTGMALSANSIDENVTANSTIGTLSTTDPDAANTSTYALVTGTGDTDNAAFNISGSNLRITTSPDFETKNSYSVRIRTTDQGGLTYEEAFAISIININEVPMGMALSANSIDENVAGNSTLGTLSAVDPDAANTFTYTLVTGTGDADNASFNISGSSLRITTSPDFEIKSSYSVRVRTTDQGGLTYEESFTITINDLNEAPTGITLSANAIDENVAGNSTLGTLSAVDPDDANTFTYTLATGAGDADNASFNIGGNSLRITSSPDYEIRSSYSIRLRTTDRDGLSYEQVFIISVNDINEAPTELMLSANTIDENVPGNSIVGVCTSIDPDASNTFTYTLVTGTGDADNSFFSISNGNLIITPSPDFETQNSYHIRIRSTDQDGLGYEENFTVHINDVNESVPNAAPTDIALSALSADENIPAHTTIGTFSSTDTNSGDIFSYTLVTGAGSTDNASFSISGDDLVILTSPDFETKSSYSIRVRTTDQGGLSHEKNFTISVADLDESPTATATVIPNVCFPNGSDQNRTWGVSHLRLTEKTLIRVYDHRGQVLFATEDPRHEWDGTHQGKPVPEDIYFYSVILADGTQYQGTLQVIY